MLSLSWLVSGRKNFIAIVSIKYCSWLQQLKTARGDCHIITDHRKRVSQLGSEREIMRVVVGNCCSWAAISTRAVVVALINVIDYCKQAAVCHRGCPLGGCCDGAAKRTVAAAVHLTRLTHLRGGAGRKCGSLRVQLDS